MRMRANDHIDDCVHDVELAVSYEKSCRAPLTRV